MMIKNILSGGKRITAGLLFIGIAIAPKVVPIVAPEFASLIPEAQMVAGAIGAALVGKSKWNHMKDTAK